ncbi:MAG: hypothetical protein HN345_09755 [Planctomycetaceae bacterium]|nr:hypothetical protein [Planctomycetaceae bacterium]MBT7728448.1 hypothetical protein [Planctomycetaceae bacterium]
MTSSVGNDVLGIELLDMESGPDEATTLFQRAFEVSSKGEQTNEKISIG